MIHSPSFGSGVLAGRVCEACSVQASGLRRSGSAYLGEGGEKFGFVFLLLGAGRCIRAHHPEF